MTSIMEHLLDTMPIAGVQGQIGPIKLSRHELLYRHLKYLPKGVDLAPVEPEKPQPDDANARIWGFTLGAEPTQIDRITCRVRAQGFNQYLVLNSLQFGLEDPGDPFKGGHVSGDSFERTVRVTPFLPGFSAMGLDLTNEFLFQTWVVRGGMLGEDQHPLWPISADHEGAILRVFIHELRPGSNAIAPFTPTGDREKAQLKKLQDTCQALAFDSSYSEADDKDPMVFGSRLFEDDLMPLPDRSSVVAQVAEVVKLLHEPIRILTVLSVTFNRERLDFQPKGLGGVARIHPHIMVRSNIPMRLVEATLRFNRPAETTSEEPMDCCSEMEPGIGAMLVTDANGNARFATALVPETTAIPLPHWSDLFNYHVADAFQAYPGQVLHMVKSAKRTERISHGSVLRIPPMPPASLFNPGGILSGNGSPSTTDVVSKSPRQGAFDNCHMAPPMRFRPASMSDSDEYSPLDFLVTKVPVTDFAALQFDKIKMAPICAHDCFHMHWRWTDADVDRPQLGWNSGRPCSSAGEPMVPRDQDVFVWLRSPHELSYHVVHGNLVGGEWSIMFHHGAGYAVWADTAAAKVLKIFVEALTRVVKTPSFYDAAGSRISATESWPLLYWHLRYHAWKTEEGEWRVADRTIFIDEVAAREL